MFFGNIFYYKFFDIYKVSYLLLHTLFYVINIAIKVSVAWNMIIFQFRCYQIKVFNFII